MDQYERRVYAYQREGASWALTEYVQDGIIPLACLKMHLTLDEIYDEILS